MAWAVPWLRREQAFYALAVTLASPLRTARNPGGRRRPQARAASTATGSRPPRRGGLACTQTHPTLVSDAQGPFGGGDAPDLPGVDRHRGTECAGQALETGFCNMVVVVAVERLDVKRQAAVLGEGLEEFTEQFGIHLAELGGREPHPPHEIGAAGDIEGDTG